MRQLKNCSCCSVPSIGSSVASTAAACLTSATVASPAEVVVPFSLPLGDSGAECSTSASCCSSVAQPHGAPGAAAAAAEKKPSLKEVVAQLDAGTPKEERNAHGEKADHFPQIAFEGGQGQGKKVVFTVPHQNLSPPSFSYIEYMWIKDENSGEILTAKKFSASDPNLVITAFGSSGQRLTAASKDDKFGVWSGTFVVP